MAAININWIILQLLALWSGICFSSCRNLVKGESGDLRFPLIGEGNPGEKLDCVWTVNVPEQFRVKLTFTDFVMKTSCCSCVHDFLEIRDGSLGNSTLVGRYCAKKEPKYVFSTRSVIWIRFLSDFRTYSGNRFRLQYEAVCGGHYTSPSGSFRSPAYPLHYGNNKDCIYSIAVPKGRIKVTFERFKIEGRMPVCLHDYLEVKEIRHVDYSRSQGHSRQSRYCGNDKPPTIYSTRGSYLWFRFKSDLSGVDAGFSAYYRTISAGEGTCGGTFKDKSGFMFSQNYPYRFPSGQECTWKIQVASDMHVHLYFDSMNFGVNLGGCSHTYLEVFDGQDTSHRIGQYCGDSIPSNIVSRTNKLLIKAVSKAEAQETGWFSLRYESSKTGACGLQKFTCVNRQCIEYYYECNSHVECDDGSDEQSCPSREGTNILKWYKFWPVSVVGGMLIVGIWLWRAWKKIKSARSEIQNFQAVTPTPSQMEMLPCNHSVELPSYSEAVAQANKLPPSYEEALREQINLPEMDRDSAQDPNPQGSMDNSSLNDSCGAHSSRNGPTSLPSMLVCGVTALPNDNLGSPYEAQRATTGESCHGQRV